MSFRREPFFSNKLTRRQKMTSGAALFTLGAVAVVWLGGGGLQDGGAANAGPQAPPPRPGLPVSVVTLQPAGPHSRSHHYTGLVRARRTSELGFDRSARVVELQVDAGDTVSRGQVLARLDTRRLKIRQREIAAETAAARATLDELIAGPRAEVIAAARAEVRSLQAQHELSQATRQRLETLHARRTASQQEFDAARFAAEAAAARLASAEERLRELEAGTRREQIDVQRAVVDQLTAAAEDVAIALSDSELLAPWDGRIAERYVDEGTVVGVGQPVLRILEHSVLEVQIGLPEQLVTDSAPTTSMEFSSGDFRFAGTLTRVHPEVDLETRTQTVVAEVRGPATEQLVPGQLVQAIVDHRVNSPGFWLPTTALSPGIRGLWSVWAVVPQDGELCVERRPVEILHTDGDRVLASGTVAAGDRVVASGVQRVIPGQRVEVRD